MKSKKLNKLARRGLTAALAASMVFGMAAPVATTAFAATAYNTVEDSSKVAVTVDKSTTKDATYTYTDGKVDENRQTNIDTIRYGYNKHAGKSERAYYTDLKFSIANPDNKNIASIKIISSNVNVAYLDRSAKENAEAFGVDTKITDSATNEATWTFTGKNVKKVQDEGVRIFALPDELVKNGDRASATVTVQAYDENGKPIGKSDSIKITVVDLHRSSSITVSPISGGSKALKEDPIDTASIKNGKFDIDLVNDKSKTVSMFIDESVLNQVGTKKLVDPDAYTITSSDESVVSFTKVRTHDYSTTSEDGRKSNEGERQNEFTITALKEGTATITVSRGEYKGTDGKEYSADSYSFVVTVKDSGTGLNVSYKNPYDDKESTVTGTAKGNKGPDLLLDIKDNTSAQIDVKTNSHSTYSFKVPEDYKQLLTVDENGKVTVKASALELLRSWTGTKRQAAIVVTAKNQEVKNYKGENATEQVVIPVTIAKNAITYVNVTNASPAGNKAGVFVANNHETAWSNYTNGSLIPLYNATDKVSQYYVVDAKSGNDNYFYQLSTKDAPTWQIEYKSNDEDNYVTFKSLDPDVATVDRKTGLVTAKAVGTARIQITAAASDKTYNDVTKTINVNVTDRYKNISVSAPESITLDSKDNTYNLDKVVSVKAGNVVATTNSNVIYGIYDENKKPIATSDGKYVAQSNGDININTSGVVTYSSKKSGVAYIGVAVKPNKDTLNTTTDNMAFVKVTYSDKKANDIAVSTDKASITVGNTVDVTATTTTPGTFAVESSDETVATATVDAAGKITITGVKAGKATITVSNTATDTTYANPADKTIEVTVTNNTLTVTPESIAFDKVGDTTTITPTTDAKGGVSYTSEDPSVAIVDAAGKVTAVKAGTTNIVVTAGTQTVKVPVAVKATETNTVIKKETTTVKVKKPTNFKAKNVKTRSIKVTAKKNGTITGFKVKYTPVGKPYDEKTVKGNKNLNTTIKGLKKGVTYKVKVQAYRKVKNGKTTTVFSKNTKVIKVKITK